MTIIAQTGVIGQYLQEAGVPQGIADPLGSATTFVIVFLLVLIGGKALVLPVANRIFAARGLDRHAKQPLRKLTWFAVVFSGIAIAFGLAGFGSFLQSLATIAAAATLAIGLAMQNVIRNFVAGVFIFTDRPFRIGEWIEWNDNAGIVEDISLRVTRVRTFDNELLTVPNSVLTEDVIKNPVATDRLRVKFVFGIGYDDDVDLATDLLIEEATDHPDILDDPEPSVRLTELGDSYVGLQSRIWIRDPSRSDALRIRSEYVANVKSRFDAEGIDIPFPQRDLSGSIDVTTAGEANGLAEEQNH